MQMMFGQHMYRPTTQKNQNTRKDPLKHSLFHNFMLTQRQKAAASELSHQHLRSYREPADHQLKHNFQNTYRTNQQAGSKPMQQPNQSSKTDKFMLPNDTFQEMKQLKRTNNSASHSQLGMQLQSRLQQHISSTNQLQRNRSNTTKHKNEPTQAQSMSLINRPMISVTFERGLSHNNSQAALHK